MGRERGVLMLVMLFGMISLAVFAGPFLVVIMLTLSDRTGVRDKKEDRW